MGEVLTKGQKRKHKELKERIREAKRTAKNDAKGEPHKYIKKANNALKKLYETQDFRANQSFLIVRYAELEREIPVAQSLLIPICIGILPMWVDTILGLLNSIGEELQKVPIEVQISDIRFIGIWAITIFWVIVSVLVLMWIIKMFIKELTRSAERTLQQNEMRIIEEILIKEGIILEASKDDGTEKREGRKSLK